MNDKRMRDLLAGLVIVLAAVLVYMPAMTGDFIWDDQVFLTRNPLIQAPDGIFRFWFTLEPTDYFPLTSSLLWFEWRLFGETAAGYHVSNILLHGANAVLFWLVLRSLGIAGAWMAGLVFAVHPVNVSTAAWITEHKNTVSTLFYLSALLAYLDSDFSRKPAVDGTELWRLRPGADRRMFRTSVWLFLLALLSKTSTVMLPLILLGCTWWRHGRIRRRDIYSTVPFFVLSLLLGLVTVWFQYTNAIAGEVTRTDGPASRLAVAARAVWFYLSKAFSPFDLSFIYTRWPLPAEGASAFGYAAVLAVLFGLGWYFRVTWGRALLFGLGYFVFSLLPVLGFLNIYFMQFSLVADHWQYLAIMGPVALATGGAHHLLGKARLPRWSVALVSAAVVSVLAGLSWQRAALFANEEALWRDTISKNSTAWMPHNNLGAALLRKGDYAGAVYHFSEAIRLKPDYWVAHYNAGNACLAWGRPEEAIFHYSRSIELRSEDIPGGVPEENAPDGDDMGDHGKENTTVLRSDLTKPEKSDISAIPDS